MCHSYFVHTYVHVISCSVYILIYKSTIYLHNYVYIYPFPQQMYVSGHFKTDGNKPRMIAVVRPVSPLSVLEIRMEGNMFVIHQKLDGRIIFFDGR